MADKKKARGSQAKLHAGIIHGALMGRTSVRNVPVAEVQAEWVDCLMFGLCCRWRWLN